MKTKKKVFAKNWCFSPKLREDQKKKKDLQPELSGFFCPKTLLSVLLLQFCNQQQYDCASLCLCAANLCVCAVSEICVRAHSLERTLYLSFLFNRLGGRLPARKPREKSLQRRLFTTSNAKKLSSYSRGGVLEDVLVDTF